MGSSGGNSGKHSIPIDILDDLCSRFIINLPQEDRSNLVRICFQVELAHWFYLDYYCTDETARLNPCGIREFAAHIFQHVPQLREHNNQLDEVLSNWREYKRTVPTYGAILLDTDLTHVLLVQSFWTKASWSFPKGKVNEDEEPWKCAAREVLEETGFDISNLLNKNHYMEATLQDQFVRLYIIENVPIDTKFQPRTRNEIKACEWFAISDLPLNKRDMTPKVKMGVSPNAFFMVLPFVKRIRRWVAERSSKVYTNARRTRHKSMGDLEASSTKAKTISQGLQDEIQEYQQQNTSVTKYKNHGQANSGNSTKNAIGSKKERKVTKRQLFTPQNAGHVDNFSPVQNENASTQKYGGQNVVKESSNEVQGSLSQVNQVQESSKDDSSLNFVAPSWADFKFDRRAILDCFN